MYFNCSEFNGFIERPSELLCYWLLFFISRVIRKVKQAERERERAREREKERER